MALLIGLTPPSSGADWRTSQPFEEVSSQVESWLLTRGGEAARQAWLAAVAEAPRASRLGPALLRIAPSNSPAAAASGAARDSLRVALAEQRLFAADYEGAREMLEDAEMDRVYSPELLAYLRVVSSHRAMDYDSARQALKALGEEAELLGPARRCVLVQVERDLAEDPEGLPLVERQMSDAARRLARGATDEPTQQRQQEALDLLDQLIEDLEKQRQQQSAAAAAGGAGAPSSPAEQSRPGELKGPGEVDRRRLVNGEDWGALPPAERERLTQDMLRGYPARYRTLVEDYFRALAESPDQPRSESARP